MKNKLNRLIEIAENSGAFKTGNFLLSSGKKSKIYFDGRIISLIPESLEIISSEILDEILCKSLISFFLLICFPPRPFLIAS